MSTVRQSIDVAVPAHLAYEQLCHLENYPQFMTGITDARPLSPDAAHLVLHVGNSQAEFDARIIDLRPDELVSWKSVAGPEVCETMRLQALSATRTRVTAQLDIDAAQLMPSESHAQEMLSRQLKADLSSFKRYVEQRLTEIPAASGQLPPNAGRSADQAIVTPPTNGRNERPVRVTPRTANLGPLKKRKSQQAGGSQPNPTEPEHGDSF
jgi:uncharacterized membrane protein